MEEKPEESFACMLQYKNDSRLSCLHVILRRSLFDKVLENEIIQNDDYNKKLQPDSSCHSPVKSVLHEIFPVLQKKNDMSLLSDKRSQKKTESAINSTQSKHRLKKLIKNRDIDIPMNKKGNSSLVIKQQPNSNKIDRIHYVFDQCNSFCPVHVPIKYGFQIRSLIENNHLPLWQFSDKNKNQIIYNPLINRNPSNDISSSFTFPSSSKQLKFSSSTAAIRTCPSSIDVHIRRRWINSLLNSGQSKGHHRQLSPAVHQSSHPSSISTTLISTKASQYKLILPKKCSDKRQTRKQYKTKRRIKCITFEEYFQRYYLPRWYLTYTREFKHQKMTP